MFDGFGTCRKLLMSTKCVTNVINVLATFTCVKLFSVVKVINKNRRILGMCFHVIAINVKPAQSSR